MTVELIPIPPGDLSPDDARWLAEGCLKLETGETPAWVVGQCVQGHLQIWRVQGKAHGIVVTQVLVHPGGNELSVWLQCGKGLLYAHEKFNEVLGIWGKELGCRWISGVVLDTILEHRYQRLGCHKVGVLMRKEL